MAVAVAVDVNADKVVARGRDCRRFWSESVEELEECGCGSGCGWCASGVFVVVVVVVMVAMVCFPSWSREEDGTLVVGNSVPSPSVVPSTLTRPAVISAARIDSSTTVMAKNTA